MKIASIIFDMDGVLLDAESIHKLATQAAFAHFGVTVSDEQYKPYRGAPDKEIMLGLSCLFPAAGLSVPELLRIKDHHYAAQEHLAGAIPGAVEFVLWAKKHYKIALATGSSPRNCASSLRMLGLEDAFQCVIDRGCVAHAKPHPEVFLKAAAGLGSAPAECLIIEDSMNGVKAARAAGCPVVAITTSYSRAQLIELGPDHVVDSFVEIRALLA